MKGETKNNSPSKERERKNGEREIIGTRGPDGAHHVSMGFVAVFTGPPPQVCISTQINIPRHLLTGLR
jgi:hypothetical protein